MSRDKVKLNEELDPSKFVVCVSTKCDLLLDEYRAVCREECSDPECDECKLSKLRAYLETLGLYETEVGSLKVGCWYSLHGRFAVEHARRVHAKIHRQLLRYEDVTAVDVGFAIQESKREFENILAIRIHVQAKKSVDALYEEGLPVFTDLRFVTEQMGNGKGPQEKGRAGDGGRPLPEKYPIAGVTRSDLSIYSYQAGNWKDDCSKLIKDPECACCHHCGQTCQDLCKLCCLCCHCCKCKNRKLCRICGEGHEPRCCRLAICGVPLDVVQASYFPMVDHPGGDFDEGVFVDKISRTDQLSDEENLRTGRGRVSPLVGGISVGSVNGLAGTLSAVVWDRTDGSPCVLANWHVLAGSATARAGQPCYQPALFDGGGSDDVIGHLKRWHFGELGDAALAELDGSRFFASGEIIGIWHPISGYQTPELNLEVRKWGRTTGFTKGFIDGIHLSTNVEYGTDLVRHFERQFHISPLFPSKEVSDRGDSGSLVLVSYDLDDLDVVASGILLGEAQCKLLDKLKDLLCCDGKDCVKTIDDLESLADAVRNYLKHNVKTDRRLSTIPPPGESEVLKPALEHLFSHPDEGGDSPGKEDDGAALLKDFTRLLTVLLEDHGVDVKGFVARKKDRKDRVARNVYYAVGMIYAGDTPGSGFGEFALASDITLLAEDLQFSLRPVFEPRSSFRRLRTRPPKPDGGRGGRRRGRGPGREPGDPGSDPRGGGPQPDPATLQSTGPGQSGSG